MDSISLIQFGKAIIQKYPQYSNQDPISIAIKAVQKYPQYKPFLNQCDLASHGLLANNICVNGTVVNLIYVGITILSITLFILFLLFIFKVVLPGIARYLGSLFFQFKQGSQGNKGK